jgi:hypothetical protein
MLSENTMPSFGRSTIQTYNVGEYVEHLEKYNVKALANPLWWFGSVIDTIIL